MIYASDSEVKVSETQFCFVLPFSEEESFEFEIRDTDCIEAPFSELSPELMFNL